MYTKTWYIRIFTSPFLFQRLGTRDYPVDLLDWGCLLSVDFHKWSRTKEKTIFRLQYWKLKESKWWGAQHTFLDTQLWCILFSETHVLHQFFFKFFFSWVTFLTSWVCEIKTNERANWLSRNPDEIPPWWVTTTLLKQLLE